MKAVRMQPTKMHLEIVNAQAPKVLSNFWVLGSFCPFGQAGDGASEQHDT